MHKCLALLFKLLILHHAVGAKPVMAPAVIKLATYFGSFLTPGRQEERN